MRCPQDHIMERRNFCVSLRFCSKYRTLTMTTIEAIAKKCVVIDLKQYIFASDDTFKGNDDLLVKKIKHTWKKAKLTFNSVLV